MDSIKRMPGKKVLIALTEPTETTAAGLIIPVKNRVDNEGVVLMTGPEAQEVSPGDKIRFYKGCGTRIKYQDKKCLILNIDELEVIL